MCLAIPGQIVDLGSESDGLASVEIGGVRRRVNVALVEHDGIALGDWVLVHVGFALSKVDEDEALATLRLLRGLGEEFEQELEELRQSAIE